jgi:hypothetical protein
MSSCHFVQRGGRLATVLSDIVHSIQVLKLQSASSQSEAQISTLEMIRSSRLETISELERRNVTIAAQTI